MGAIDAAARFFRSPAYSAAMIGLGGLLIGSSVMRMTAEPTGHADADAFLHRVDIAGLVSSIGVLISGVAATRTGSLHLGGTLVGAGIASAGVALLAANVYDELSDNPDGVVATSLRSLIPGR